MMPKDAKNLRAIALDDEPLALTLIQKYATETDGLDLLASFTNAKLAMDFLQNNQIDLLISDISMPDVTGLQVARNLSESGPMIIFVTAHKEYAHEGFELDVVDYLVKPISPERFQTAIQKAQKRLVTEHQLSTQNSSSEEHFYVFSDYKQIKIRIKDILYIEGMGDYVKIHQEGQSKPVITLERMKKLAGQLHNYGFRRIHRSYIINIDKIEERQKTRVCIAGNWLSLGETFEMDF
jgi:two-component system, LytTR family, response regulator